MDVGFLLPALCRGTAASREKGSVQAAGWAPGAVASPGFLFPTPCARRLGGRGWSRAEEPRGGRWGFPRALREGEHSESKAKGQSRLGSGNSPWGWVVGNGGAGKGLGPGVSDTSPIPESPRPWRGSDWDFHGLDDSPLSPNTHPGIKVSILLAGLPERKPWRWGLCLSPNSHGWDGLHCQTRMRGPDPVQRTGVPPSHHRTE